MGVFKLTKRKFGLGLSLVLAAGTILGACGSKDEETTTPKDSEGTVLKVRTEAVRFFYSNGN